MENAPPPNGNYYLASEHERRALSVAMAKQDLKGKTLASLVGCSPATISGLRKNSGKKCSAQLAAAIAEAVNLPFDYLFTPTSTQTKNGVAA